MVVQFKVGGIGEVLWDAFPDGETFGGAPANFACHCHSLGAQTYVVSATGADQRGIKAREFLSDHGVNIHGLAIMSDCETGVVNVTQDELGHPAYEIREHVAWDVIPWSDELETIAGDLDAVCFGSLAQRSSGSRRNIQEFLKRIPEGSLKIFDINLRGTYYSAALLEDSIQLCNLLKMSDEELPVLAEVLALNAESESGMLKQLVERYDLCLAVCTRGSKGSILVSADTVDEHPGCAADVVCTVGAGDSFSAALCMGLLQGLDLHEINHFANHVAAFVCSNQGATPQLPASFKNVLNKELI